MTFLNRVRGDLYGVTADAMLTDKHRATAKPKYQMWEKEPPPLTTMWTERARG